MGILQVDSRFWGNIKTSMLANKTWTINYISIFLLSLGVWSKHTQILCFCISGMHLLAKKISSSFSKDMLFTIPIPDLSFLVDLKLLGKVFEAGETHTVWTRAAEEVVSGQVGLDRGALQFIPLLQPQAIFSIVGEKKRKAKWCVKRSTARGTVSHLDVSWGTI